MAKKKAAKAAAASESAGKPSSPHILAMFLLAVATLVFHWEPLFNSQTSIQWDSVDVHYSAQKYFADHVREGEFPTGRHTCSAAIRFWLTRRWAPGIR